MKRINILLWLQVVLVQIQLQCAVGEMMMRTSTILMCQKDDGIKLPISPIYSF